MDIFPHPTVASLALPLKQLALDQALHELSDSVVVVRRTGSQRPLFLVHFIRCVQPDGPVQVPGWSFGGMLASRFGVQLQARRDEAEFIGLLDAEFVFDQAPSVRPNTAQGILMLSCEGQAEAMAYEQLFARCAEAERLPHYLARMNATKARQYFARLVAQESAIEADRPQAAALPERIFVAREEADPDNEYLEWDKVLSPQHLGLARVQGNHRTMVETHAEALGQAVSSALMSGAARGSAVQM